MELTIVRHAVKADPASGLSPLQEALLNDPRRIRIASAPTGAGKSYAFLQAVAQKGQRVLFIVPTRRLAQNLAAGFTHDLVNTCHWSQTQAEQKVVIWSSDQSAMIRDQQPTISISGLRLRQLLALDDTREGGEIIFAIPEVVSHLLLQKYRAVGQAGLSIIDFLVQFDHVVFDEFHTIEARGFGLAALCARLVSVVTAQGSPIGRAKVSFLSATPLALLPVLTRLGIAKTDIAELEEVVEEVVNNDSAPQQRLLHGDVVLHFSETPALATLVAEQQDLVAHEVAAGRQVVIIYNALGDLRRQLPDLGAICDSIGLSRQRVLVINSIDDSRHQEGRAAAGFYAGRQQNPDQFSILIATASVEMGVTFRAANVLFMEPGFEPINFLQRYGRAARRGEDGHVWVKTDPAMHKTKAWQRTLLSWATLHHGEWLGIAELTAVLSKDIQKSFAPMDDSQPRYFGKLPHRAAYIAGLYWNMLLQSKSNQGPRKALLLAHQPSTAIWIRSQIRAVRDMERDKSYGHSAKEWCDRFEEQVRTLRNIGQRIRVVQGDGNIVEVDQVWLARETTILQHGIRQTSADGRDEIQLLDEGGDIDDYLLTPRERKRVKRTATVYFPHTSHTESLVADGELVDAWCRKLEERRGFKGIAWDDHPGAMKAATQLVQYTGLVPGDEDDLSMATHSAVY